MRVLTIEIAGGSLAPAPDPDDYVGGQLASPSAGGTIPRHNMPERLFRRVHIGSRGRAEKIGVPDMGEQELFNGLIATYRELNLKAP